MASQQCITLRTNMCSSSVVVCGCLYIVPGEDDDAVDLDVAREALQRDRAHRGGRLDLVALAGVQRELVVIQAEDERVQEHVHALLHLRPKCVVSREDACAATVRLQQLAIGAFALVAMLEKISLSV